MGQKPVRTQTDQSLCDNSPSSKEVEKKNKPSQAHPSYSKKNPIIQHLKNQYHHLEEAEHLRVGWQSHPPSPRELLSYAPAVFACVLHSSLATRVQVLFFWVVLRTSCSISHTPEANGASGKPTRCGLATQRLPPRSSHAFGPSGRHQHMAPHHHQVTGTEILDMQQPC